MDEQVGPAQVERDPDWISYEEFLEQCDEDTYAEWVDGRVVPISPVSRRHQQVQQFLLIVVAEYVGALNWGRCNTIPSR